MLDSFTTTSVLEFLSLGCTRLRPTSPSASTSNTWQMPSQQWQGRPAMCAIPHGLQNHGVNLTHQALHCLALEAKHTPEREREGGSTAATSADVVRWALLPPDARESGSSVTLCFLDSTFRACHSAKAQLVYKAFNWKVQWLNVLSQVPIPAILAGILQYLVAFRLSLRDCRNFRSHTNALWSLPSLEKLL